MNSNDGYKHNHGVREINLEDGQFRISVTTVELKKKQPDVRFYAASISDTTPEGPEFRIHFRSTDIEQSDRVKIQEGCIIENDEGQRFDVLRVRHSGRPMNPYVLVRPISA